MNKIRKCNNPEPSCGGKDCVGSSNIQLDVPCSNACCSGKIMHWNYFAQEHCGIMQYTIILGSIHCFIINTYVALVHG